MTREERAERGDYGAGYAGPPWILGHRGAPREAPENTLAGLRRALEIGCDGFEYDMRACASREAVLIHDRTLERTTDATGPVAARTLPELFGIDAGSWFSKRYRGEPVPLFDEALEVVGAPTRGFPFHMIELKETGLVEQVAEKLAGLRHVLEVRVASFLREVVSDARDAGLQAMLLAVRASEDDRRFVRDERLTAYATGPDGWCAPAGSADWSFCERWAWSVDEPEDLLAVCRMPLAGFNTNEPHRALATRALVTLAPDDEGPFPIEVPALDVEPEALAADVRERGEWYGAWSVTAGIRNPFAFPVEVGCGLFIRNGAFEIEGLPARIALGPGEQAQVPFEIVGGSRSPGGDPLVGAHYRWRTGPGRAAGALLLDAPLHRVRSTRVDGLARRVNLLAERPGDEPASMILRRKGPHLFVSLENAGGLEEAHTIVRLGTETVRGGKGLRLSLPADFDTRPSGAPFSCGLEGRRAGERCVRRWAGGVPEGLAHGVPGRLVPDTGD